LLTVFVSVGGGLGGILHYWVMLCKICWWQVLHSLWCWRECNLMKHSSSDAVLLNSYTYTRKFIQLVELCCYNGVILLTFMGWE
jgi:hypothetical protein